MNRSGLWSMLFFAAFVGHIWLFIECAFKKGTDGPNQYGPDPLAPILEPPVSQSVTPIVAPTPPQVS